MQNLLPELKADRPELLKVHSQVLQNIAGRIRLGYDNFFARRKVGLRAGLPRFRKYGRYKSITYPQFGFRVEGNRLLLSKIGAIRIRQHRDIQGQIKTLTVKRMPSGKWYACFSCVVEAQPREKPLEDIGIDVGLHSYAVLSDGVRIENPRFYRKSEKKLGLLQRGLSRKERGSRNWVKAKTRVARLHEKIGNRRTDFLHKASREIADAYETVYFEDLKIGNMVKNYCLAKSIGDAGWGRFIGMIAYKEEESGGKLIKVNPKGTTQKCSRCGEKVKKTLSDRIHECPHCGLVMDRDLNAALNILARGREIRREPPESRPAEEETTTPPLEVVQVYPVKQEVFLLGGR
jgi:putative transposase